MKMQFSASTYQRIVAGVNDAVKDITDCSDSIYHEAQQVLAEATFIAPFYEVDMDMDMIETLEDLIDDV